MGRDCILTVRSTKDEDHVLPEVLVSVDKLKCNIFSFFFLLSSHLSTNAIIWMGLVTNQG